MAFLFEIIRLGLSNLRLHLLRSVLAALGIILGVAAVITMVSLGEGSKQQALRQIEALGARNIIIRSQPPPAAGNVVGGQTRSFINRYGITRADYEVVLENFGDVEAIVPLKEIGSQLLKEDRVRSSQTFGTTPALLEVARLRIARGTYLTDAHLETQALVCVLGSEVARAFFPATDPLGQTIRIDDKTLTVVGVLAPVGLAGGAGAALVGRDLNQDVHIPITTAEAVFGDLFVRRETGSFSGNEVQISEVYLTSPTRERVLSDAARLKRIFETRHPGMLEIQLVVPYELLENARKTAITYTVVFGAIAGIALVVGGIGIMNIMLATVQERIREIGIRRALGATRRHVLAQFVVETGVLSVIGGLVGVGLGVVVSEIVPVLPKLPVLKDIITADAQLYTDWTYWSVAVAFCVATLVGLIAGIYPALQAARQDPIVALRHD